MSSGGIIGDFPASIPKPQNLQAIVEILHNNATQLQEMDEQLKNIAATSQHTAHILDSQLPNTATINKEAETCLPNTSENISSQYLSPKPSIPHRSHESATLTPNTTIQRPHPTIESLMNC